MVFEQESANLQLLFGEMLFSVSFCLHAVIHLFSIVAVAASSQGLCRLSKVSGWLELKVSVFTAFSHLPTKPNLQCLVEELIKISWLFSELHLITSMLIFHLTETKKTSVTRVCLTVFIKFALCNMPEINSLCILAT